MLLVEGTKGNSCSVWATVGASNHTEHERASNDFYATEPRAVELLMDNEQFDGSIWENCCGMGHLSKPMVERGYTVISTDLIDRGYGKGGVDFFQCKEALGDNIVTNPPYSMACDWVYHSLELLEDGKKLALFLKLTFLESQERKELFSKMPPKVVYVSSNRLVCGINGDFTAKDRFGNTVYNKDGTPKKMSSAQAYAWFVWVKGDYGSDPIIKWIN